MYRIYFRFLHSTYLTLYLFSFHSWSFQLHDLFDFFPLFWAYSIEGYDSIIFLLIQWGFLWTFPLAVSINQRRAWRCTFLLEKLILINWSSFSATLFAFEKLRSSTASALAVLLSLGEVCLFYLGWVWPSRTCKIPKSLLGILLFPPETLWYATSCDKVIHMPKSAEGTWLRNEQKTRPSVW